MLNSSELMSPIALRWRMPETKRAHGSVLLIFCANNAGVIGQASIDNANYGDWDTILAVNLGGVINGIVSFLPDMKAQRHGTHCQYRLDGGRCFHRQPVPASTRPQSLRYAG